MVHSCRVQSHWNKHFMTVKNFSTPTTTNSVETRTGGLIVLRYSWKYRFLPFSHNFNFVTNVSQFPWLLLDSQHNVRFVTSLRWREYVTCFWSALRRNSLWQAPVARNYRKLGPFRRIIWFQGPSRARSASAGVGIAATPEYLFLVSLRLLFLFIRRLLLRLLVFLFFFTFLLFISRACEQICWAETKGGVGNIHTVCTRASKP